MLWAAASANLAELIWAPPTEARFGARPWLHRSSRTQRLILKIRTRTTAGRPVRRCPGFLPTAVAREDSGLPPRMKRHPSAAASDQPPAPERGLAATRQSKAHASSTGARVRERAWFSDWVASRPLPCCHRGRAHQSGSLRIPVPRRTARHGGAL